MFMIIPAPAKSNSRSAICVSLRILTKHSSQVNVTLPLVPLPFVAFPPPVTILLLLLII